MVYWLRRHASSAGGMGLIPGQGTKILHVAVWPKKKKKKEGIEVPMPRDDDAWVLGSLKRNSPSNIDA